MTPLPWQDLKTREPGARCPRIHNRIVKPLHAMCVRLSTAYHHTTDNVIS